MPDTIHEADNPALWEPLEDDRPDPHVTYAVGDGIRFGEYDEFGNWWFVKKTTGWHSPVKRRTARTKRPHSDGSYRSRSRKDERPISLVGHCMSPSIGARQAALDAFADTCGDDGTLHELRVTDQLGRVRTADVEIDDGDTVLRHERLFDFTLELTAPDPRKHGAWQDPIAPLQGLRSGFLSFPLQFPLNFGQPPGGQGGVVQVANYGTERAYPFIKLTGPMPAPSLIDDAHGWSLDAVTDLAAGEQWFINCDDFRAKGYRGHACWSTTRGRIRSLIRRTGDWPMVEPRSVSSFRVNTAGRAPAEFMVSLRSAWR